MLRAPRRSASRSRSRPRTATSSSAAGPTSATPRRGRSPRTSRCSRRPRSTRRPYAAFRGHCAARRRRPRRPSTSCCAARGRSGRCPTSSSSRWPEGVSNCECARAWRCAPARSAATSTSTTTRTSPWRTTSRRSPLDRAFTDLADYSVTFEVGAYHLYELGDDGVWRPVARVHPRRGLTVPALQPRPGPAQGHPRLPRLDPLRRRPTATCSRPASATSRSSPSSRRWRWPSRSSASCCRAGPTSSQPSPTRSTPPCPGWSRRRATPTASSASQPPASLTLTMTGIISFVTLLLAGLGWVGPLRTGIRGVFGLEASTDTMVRTKARDLFVLVDPRPGDRRVGRSSRAPSAVSPSASPGWIGLAGNGLLVGLVGLLVGVVFDTLILVVLLRMLSGAPLPMRNVRQGAVARRGRPHAAQAVRGLPRQPRDRATRCSGPSRVSVGLLFWLDLMSKVILLSAAWAANDVDLDRLGDDTAALAPVARPASRVRRPAPRPRPTPSLVPYAATPVARAAGTSRRDEPRSPRHRPRQRRRGSCRRRGRSPGRPAARRLRRR